MKQLFGEVDNLNMFIHPKFNEKFKFMDDKQSILLANKILNKFIESGYKNIVVIESGTSPLIKIIKKLKKYKDINFNIKQIKIPRDLDFNLYEWFKTYLTKEELNGVINYNGKEITRNDALKKVCSHFDLLKFVGNEKFTIYDSVNNTKQYNDTSLFHSILLDTNIYEIFNSEFLLFDEYINAGTIIRNFNAIARLFTNNPKYKLSAFCMFLDEPQKYNKIAFTLFDNSTELQCYREGAYPFENRIDLIGYYYFINQNNFEKVYLSDLKNELVGIDDNIEELNNKLIKLIDDNNLLNKLKVSLKEEQVKNYVDYYDIIRFIYKYLDEKLYGKTKYSDFLDQVFELYAPSWSPMPVIFHLDYWNGFNEILIDIDKVCEQIKTDYQEKRKGVIQSALNSLEINNKKWIDNINKELEVQ